jgi:hypothetical protein
MDIERIKHLIAQREEIDRELVTLVTGASEKRAVVCSVCNTEGHTARKCPQKTASPPAVANGHFETQQ